MDKEQKTSVAHPVFFPIPNPLPHIRSIDIPTPVIFPPGIDPYSVLNPNSGLASSLALDVNPSAASRTGIIRMATNLTASRLDSLPALDVNPGAASRTEIIIKTTSLTASEHAGGKWSEPRIDSTASHSRATSVSSAIAQSPVEDDTLYQELEKKEEQDLLQNEASIESLFARGISDVGWVDLVSIRPLCTEVFPNPISVSTTPVLQSDSGPQNAQEKLKVHQFLWCEVCKVSCNSEKSLGRHILGKKHLKNIKNSEKIQAPPSTNIATTATTPVTKPAGNLKSTEGNIVDSEALGGKISWSSNIVLSNHASGKENMKSHQKSEKKPDLPSTHIASLVENPKSTKGKIIVNSEEGKSARCELCGISCNSYEKLSQHIGGKKHQKNIKKSENFFTPVAEGSLQDSKNEEGKLVIVEACKRKANSSLAGDEDLDTKKQKMMKEEKLSGSSFTCKL